MRNQSGISLIEVLIALVVFAVGVGGMVGLQLRSVGMSLDSKQRAIVIAKSQELADRMRSNRAFLTDYVGSYSNAGGTYCATLPAANCADSNLGSATVCGGVQLAAFDVWDVFCQEDSGVNESVINWATEITCSTAGCVAGRDTVTISTDWVARTGDTNKDLVGNAAIDPSQDQLTMSFTP